MIRVFAIWAAMAAVLLSYSLPSAASDTLKLANERPEAYLPLLRGKKVGLLSNHTGIDRDSVHTLDKLLAAGVNVTTLFSPEHGFRGDADAGQKVGNAVDQQTGLPVVSLYGTKSLPLPAKVMNDVDVFVVDLQDVGLRFYTYYITMLKLMDEAAREEKEFIVFDRPNPLGMTVDGPVLDMSLKSGVGALPIPVVHGMTMGELARMIVGEGWLKQTSSPLALTVVEMEGYTHDMRFQLLNRPSPNLKSMHAVYLYPSTCLFEGTAMSLGRGTEHPFEMYGHPEMRDGEYTFTPRPMPGAKNPPLAGKKCHGRNLQGLADDDIIAGGMNLEYVIDAYRHMPRSVKFFTSFFDLLTGDRSIRRQIESGRSAADIKASWQEDVEQFRQKRSKYLLYK